ncbi:hypothetical protein P3T43_007189 [Paraburkholderia sp. GAS41]|uniref:DUF3331 domain-containing protein n=1 Tax=Paraburkholderia sp. GAS41 TaxID=3035134 RepID=UPI003D1A0C39
MKHVNPWSQVVSLLSYLSSGVDSVAGEPWPFPCRPAVHAARIGKLGTSHQTTTVPAPPGKISSIERQGDASALISWCDPTMCHYVDQVWSRVRARSSGYCALTGQRIERGDAVFKPRGRGRLRPVNYEEMILATALE